jgi:hypothetical protein
MRWWVVGVAVAATLVAAPAHAVAHAPGDGRIASGVTAADVPLLYDCNGEPDECPTWLCVLVGACTQSTAQVLDESLLAIDVPPIVVLDDNGGRTVPLVDTGDWLWPPRRPTCPWGSVVERCNQPLTHPWLRDWWPGWTDDTWWCGSEFDNQVDVAVGWGSSYTCQWFEADYLPAVWY